MIPFSRDVRPLPIADKKKLWRIAFSLFFSCSHSPFSRRPLIFSGDRSSPEKLRGVGKKTTVTEKTHRCAKTFSTGTTRHSKVSKSFYLSSRAYNDVKAPKRHFLLFLSAIMKNGLNSREKKVLT